MEQKKLHLTAEEREIIDDILRRCAKGWTVKAFGSRVDGKPRKFSDLDLAFILPNGEKLSLLDRGKLRKNFEMSELPFRVDIVDYNLCEDFFKEIINENSVVIHNQ
jgi:predicted nucleotidyltransferase